MLKWIAILVASLAGMLAMAAPASAQYSSQVKCESIKYRPAECVVGNIADVRVSRMLGGMCRQGIEWRYDRRAIYVNNGCRAYFDVRLGNQGGGYGGGYGSSQAVRCESRDYRPQRCTMDTRGGVHIQRVIGNAPCSEGQSWGYDRNAVWVSSGCRADFVAGGAYAGGGGWHDNNGNGRIIECNSRDYRPARCSAEIERGASIERVLGGECIQGRTWGWDRKSIWVNDGCRARFRVY